MVFAVGGGRGSDREGEGERQTRREGEREVVGHQALSGTWLLASV